jgi:excisionase family DNA binding protein
VLSDEAIDRIVESAAALALERLGAIASSSAWMNLKTTAEYLDWPPKRLYNLVSKGEIPHRKHGNRLLFNRREIDRWLDCLYEGPDRFAP